MVEIRLELLRLVYTNELGVDLGEKREVPSQIAEIEAYYGYAEIIGPCLATESHTGRGEFNTRRKRETSEKGTELC
jgi:hypothetical protein